MKSILRAVATCVSLAIGVWALPSDEARAAAQIVAQAPCAVAPGRECFNFGVGISGLPHFSLRTFTYRAPSKGTAQVTFNGSLLCGAYLGGQDRVVDLVTQITNSRSTTPAVDQPSGLRQALVLRAYTSDTLNLAATRVFSFSAAGSQTFSYEVRPLRIDAGTNCFLYNAAFTVNFVP